MANFLEDLRILLKSKTKCIWIKSYEENKVIEDIRCVVGNNFPNFKLFTWSFYEGIRQMTTNDKERLRNNNNVEEPTPMPPDKIFETIANAQKKGRIIESSGKKQWVDKDEGIYILKDFHLLNDNKLLIRGLRDIEENFVNKPSYNPIIIISPIVSIPLEHEKMFTIIDYDLPNDDEIKTIMNGIIKASRTTIEEDVFERCVNLARGLTLNEIKNYCARSVNKYGAIKEDIFYAARIDLIKKTGILEYLEPKYSMDDMGGNEAFKRWVSEIKETFTPEAEEFGVDKSKGFLALGVPGTAKSLSAEMIASMLHLPLLKFNMASVMHSHVGQSEKNMQNAISLVKSCSPCVLLIDEAEKTLSGKKSKYLYLS